MDKEKPITIIGCGPGSEAYLTALGKTAALGADFLVGSKKLLGLFGDSRAERVETGANVELALSEIGKRYATGKVAVLVSGDPGVCSLARPVIGKFGIENCAVIPGVSSVQLAFAKIGVEWYDAKIVTAHNRDPEIPFTELEKEKKIAVLAGREGAMAWIARLAGAIGARYDIYVCEDLSGEKEKITKAAPQTLNGYAASTLTVVLFIGRELER